MINFADPYRLCYYNAHGTEEQKALTLRRCCFGDTGSDHLHDIHLSYTSAFGLGGGVEYTNYGNDNSQQMAYLTDAFIYRRNQHIDRIKAYGDMQHTWKSGWTLSYLFSPNVPILPLM